MMINEWTRKHNISPEAITELQQLLMGPCTTADPAISEAGVQSRIRLEAVQAGCYLWRNNVGAMLTDSGRPVRYGLANDSKQLNRVIKSADLIGVRPLVITPAHVGRVIGQFLSREVKASGWKYTGTDRERAQLAWATLIASVGGDACFASSTGTLLTNSTTNDRVGL